MDIAALLAVSLTLAGAVTDARSGKIYNWLTFPAIGLGVLLAGVQHGPLQAIYHAVAAAACAAIPYLGFVAAPSDEQEVGGGDVKVFAALGAILGLRGGFEAEFLSLLTASVSAMGILIWRRQVLTTLGNAFYLTFNLALPRPYRRAVPASSRTKLRIGPYIFVGTVAAVLLHKMQEGV